MPDVSRVVGEETPPLTSADREVEVMFFIREGDASRDDGDDNSDEKGVDNVEDEDGEDYKGNELGKIEVCKEEDEVIRSEDIVVLDGMFDRVEPTTSVGNTFDADGLPLVPKFPWLEVPFVDTSETTGVEIALSGTTDDAEEVLRTQEVLKAAI